jgi:hypothetical protein
MKVLREFRILAIIVTGLGLSGCNVKPTESQMPIPDKSLSAEDCKESLLANLRSDASRFPEGLDVETLAEASVVVHSSGTSASWGPFWFDLTDHSYQFTLQFGAAPLVCVQTFRGAFALHGGTWRAAKPARTEQTLMNTRLEVSSD